MKGMAEVAAIIVNLKIMDLTKRREELLKEIEQLEIAKKSAHEEILKRKAKLRKLALVERDAEELFESEDVSTNWGTLKGEKPLV